jgi:hypothetical protein
VIDATKTTTFFAAHGRDAGKHFELREADPLAMAGYVLRLVSALRIPSYETLLAVFARNDDDNGAPGGEAIDAILRILQGADPVAVHALCTEALHYVRIAPDPQHPEAWRTLMPTDIRELRTLGDVLVAFVKLNFDTGA